MSHEIKTNTNELLKAGRVELGLDEAEKVTGGYWIIDNLPKKKEPEPGGASGGW